MGHGNEGEEDSRPRGPRPTRAPGSSRCRCGSLAVRRTVLGLRWPPCCSTQSNCSFPSPPHRCAVPAAAGCAFRRDVRPGRRPELGQRRRRRNPARKCGACRLSDGRWDGVSARTNSETRVLARPSSDRREPQHPELVAAHGAGEAEPATGDPVCRTVQHPGDAEEETRRQPPGTFRVGRATGNRCVCLAH